MKSIFAILVASLLALGAGAAAEKPAITVHMIGDSTMANKPLVPANSERGWGQLLSLYFDEGVRIQNYAVNGRSSKSFMTEGRWKTVLQNLKPGDYVIIQFGHNDEKTNSGGTEPFGSFKANLEQYVRESREHQASPILATPIARRRFDKDGKFFDTHGDYPVAMRKVAEEQKVPLLELHGKTIALLQHLGPDLSLKLFNHVAPGEYATHPDGQKDDTHLNSIGATRVCDLAIEEIAAKVPQLAPHLKK